jgi:DNA-binding response OmpR family regulator
MIVEDDTLIAESMKVALSAAGHEVVVHLQIEPVVASMRQKKPDLLILDLMFPGNKSGGFDLARTIRTEFKGEPALPILMLSAVNQVYRMGFTAGDIDDEWMPVTDFVEKPVDAGVLKTKVAELLAKAKK